MSNEEQQENTKLHNSTPIRAHKRLGGPLSSEQRKEAQRRFLAVFSETANIKYSCKAAGIDRKTFYDWKEKDKAFQALLSDAEPDADDTLEYAAYLRAVEGVEKPLVSVGKIICGDNGQPIMMREYSDQLLVTLLKARLPEKYREKQTVDLNANVNAQVQASHEIAISPRDLTDEELATMKTLAKNAMERKKQKGEQ